MRKLHKPNVHERLKKRHDNMISNEDVVIKDTFAEFRKAVAAK